MKKTNFILYLVFIILWFVDQGVVSAIPMLSEGSDFLEEKSVIDRTKRAENLSTGTSEASSRSASEVAFSEANSEENDGINEEELYQDTETGSFSGEIAKQLAIDERRNHAIPSLISEAALLLQAAKKVTLDVRPEASELVSN